MWLSFFPQQVIEEFEIGCIVCTSVAVDQKTQQPVSVIHYINLHAGTTNKHCHGAH